MTGALLIVDYSNDFIADAGAMSCGAAGQALDGNILRQAEQALARQYFVFICNDEHHQGDPFDPEAALFPPHNLAGSWGAEIYGQTGAFVRRMQEQGSDRIVYVPKLRYSAFFGTPLDYLLRSRGVDELIVAGVCTDICVLHTVIAAVYEGYRVKVPADCCATIFEHGQEWALRHLRDCLNVEII
ncbi:MAG: cysteine hydrolase [Clostridia bacterium]|nr:cysteine hydrolase [Clostridia bacterium]